MLYLFIYAHSVLSEQGCPVYEGPGPYHESKILLNAVALSYSAIKRWHSLSLYPTLAAAKVDVTGTNYQCQIIILKKRLTLARDQT